MNGFGAIVMKMAKKADESNPPSDDEYINKDDHGLLYCSKCHTRCQSLIEVPDGDGGTVEIRPRVPCKCRTEAVEEERRKKEQAALEERIAKMKMKSGIPALYTEASFGTFTQTKENAPVFKMAKRYAEKFDEMKSLGKGLLFHGGVGTGKTYTAACIGNALIDAGFSVFMTSTYEMLKLRETDDEELYESRVFGSSLLIVDDIGAERTTDYGREKVFGYIDGRCNTGLPMIFTTNLDFQKMLKPDSQQEARIYDRIMKRCFPVAFVGESWRRAEARDNFAEMKAILNGSD